VASFCEFIYLVSFQWLLSFLSVCCCTYFCHSFLILLLTGICCFLCLISELFTWSFSLYSLLCALCGLQGCKNRPAPFRGRISYKVTKPGLTCLSYLSMLYIVLLFIRAPFYLLLIFVAMCSGFWLFWLSCQYLPSDWLERLLSGSLTLARGSSQKPQAEECYVILLLYYIVS